MEKMTNRDEAMKCIKGKRRLRLSVSVFIGYVDRQKGPATFIKGTCCSGKMVTVRSVAEMKKKVSAIMAVAKR